ncbi:hypothetical protein V6N11_023825 [Hibiscus sabdariffa]|uniref:Reverse transcriptase n=1 Tax=Hibiscus sabdariffa TaxID=183260 RepID=A0ABR2TNC8_9ROSI
MKMKIDNAFYVEPKGIMGGLALWWSNTVKLTVLHYDKHSIDTLVSINDEGTWYGTFIYAPPYAEDKQRFWERLASLRMESKGGTYTWLNQRSNEDAILEKIDRVLSSLEWNFQFPRAIALTDIVIASDHAPIVLLTNGAMKKAKKDFKFESKWLCEEECSQVIKEEWERTGRGPSKTSFRVKLRRTRVKLAVYLAWAYIPNLGYIQLGSSIILADEFSREACSLLSHMEGDEQPIEPISDLGVDKINILMFDDAK